jgi:hypothetical protein
VTFAILANLDCEARWGGQALPLPVIRRISAASALLAALAPGDDVEIWAPGPVDAARIRFASPVMRVGAPSRVDLAWADPDAKVVNDRRLALAVARELDGGVPGTCVVDSLAALDAHVATLAQPWVCKVPWSAAARDRARGDGARVDGELRIRVGRLLDRAGALIVEPWLERTFDLGVCARVDRDGDVTSESPHTLVVDARGGFVGIDLSPPPLADGEPDRLARAVAAAGAALAARSYAGPFTVDAFGYRVDGERRFRPLCEINARHSFGHVARALAARLGTRVLGFGAPPPGATVLIAATADDPFTAWARGTSAQHDRVVS